MKKVFAIAIFLLSFGAFNDAKAQYGIIHNSVMDDAYLTFSQTNGVAKSKRADLIYQS